MRDKDKRKQHSSGDDLKEIRRMLDGAEEGDYTLEGILEEFSTKKDPQGTPLETTELPDPELDVDLPWKEVQPRPHSRDNLVSFPNGETPGEEPLAEEEQDSDLELLQEEDWPEAADGDKVVEFPEEESLLSALIKDLSHKADRYADQMFPQESEPDPEEVRRLEELIPGTDWEEPVVKSRYARPRRPAPPPPEDLPARELAEQYGRGLKGMRLRSLGVFFLAVAAIFFLLVPALPEHLILPPPLHEYTVQAWSSVGCLALGMALSWEILASGLGGLFRLRVGMETLLSLACAATLADGLLLALGSAQRETLPYCAVTLVALYFYLHGAYHKRHGQRLSCRTAASASEPYLVTQDEGKWSGQDTYTKWSGLPTGFGSQIQMDDGAQRIFFRVCPIVLLGCVLFSLLNSVAAGEPDRLAWCLSATLTAASALGATLVYGRSFHKLSRRVTPNGGALAGWPGAAQSRRGNRVLLTDQDLFPPGCVELNGMKIMEGFPLERVVAYTATLIRDAGSGLDPLFHGLLRSQGAIYRRTEGLSCYEGGGLSAAVRGDQVLVGSAAFMNLMEVALPPGLNVKQAVFCAINGELAGIFAVSYQLPETVFPCVSALLRERVGPVLATRDFNLNPAMLQQRFKLAAHKMDFPPIQRRRELSDPRAPHNEILTAVLCREGIVPYAETVVGARKLCRTVRLGAILCCVGSVAGLLLAAYLTAVGAYTSLSPQNLLLFLVAWLAPVWFLTDLPHRF